MAAVREMLGTALTGRLGNLVYYQMNGKTFTRTLPGKRTGEGTPNQVLQRKRFGEMIKFSKKFKYVLIPQIWNQASSTRHGFQLFMKTNKKAFGLQGELPDVKKIQLSIGILQLPGDITLERLADDPSRLKVTWVEGFYSGGMPFWDELLVISCGEGLYSDIHYTGIRRGDLQGIFELPALDVPATHVYLFFASLDRQRYSDSMCMEI